MLTSTFYQLDPADEAPCAAFRTMTASRKGLLLGPEARPMFNASRAATPLASGVRIEAGTVGGVDGLWCRVAPDPTEARLLFLHGGGYMMGSASATANFASHLAAGSAADTFVADYRLAPEAPFPAAFDDSMAAYRGLVDGGVGPVAITGESAGGGLTLALLAALDDDDRRPSAVAVMSPWTDLTLAGESFVSRAEADPIFTRDAMAGLAATYLQGRDAEDFRASPLLAAIPATTPIRIDVGEDEVLLSDAVRYAERADEAGAEVILDIWQGMPHVFQARVDQLVAAQRSFRAASAFLHQALHRPVP